MENRRSQYIYEFDLKGFFDNVDLSFLAKECERELGMPKETAEWFMQMNQSIVRLSDFDELDETSERRPILTGEGGINPNPRKDFEFYSETEADWDKPGFAEAFALFAEMYGGPGMKVRKERGVPQGAATSCSLSTICLSKVTNMSEQRRLELGLSASAKIVMYADDGLIFGSSEDEIRKLKDELASCRVPINEEKSG